MKIRLLRDVPMMPEHKCTEGKVFDCTMVGGQYWITTGANKRIFLYPHELHVIQEGESTEEIDVDTSQEKTPENESESVQ